MYSGCFSLRTRVAFLFCFSCNTNIEREVADTKPLYLDLGQTSKRLKGVTGMTSGRLRLLVQVSLGRWPPADGQKDGK